MSEYTPEEVKKYREACRGLVVCVPTLDWSMNSSLARFLMTTSSLGSSFITVDNTRPNEYARNIMAGMFLDKTERIAKRLWFIDSDMLPAEGALRLLDVDSGPRGGIISARCVFAGGTRMVADAGIGVNPTFNGFKYVKGRRPPFEPVKMQKGVQDIDACGTASIIIDRAVLADTSLWYDGEYTNMLTGDRHDCSLPVLNTNSNNDMLIPPIFRAHHAPNGQPILSQDIDFSWRVKQAGYSVQYAHDIHFGHLKRLNMDVILEHEGSQGSQEPISGMVKVN